MSLFSGFSSAVDERRALELSRRMTQKAFAVLAAVARMHRPAGETLRDPELNDGQPFHLCVECGRPHPCPTWETVVDYTRNAP